MNLDFHQTSANPLAGMVDMDRQDLQRPLPRSLLGDLQPNQLVIGRVDEPAAIRDLRTMREEEQGSETPITIGAFSEAMGLLEFVHLVLSDLPRTLLIPSGEGGITVEWFRDDRTVRAIIAPKTDQAYVYVRIGRRSDVKPFSKSAVVQALRTVIAR
jgi:hypothetical protein